jgi:CubicO group peptidase (beta-lactamase class C family)
LPPNPRFEELVDEIFDLTGVQGVTHAFLVVRGGELVFERYNAGANAPYLQYSWSMAKSITQALAGILVKQGRLDIYAPARVPEWQRDARREVTLDQLLRMSWARFSGGLR